MAFLTALNAGSIRAAQYSPPSSGGVGAGSGAHIHDNSIIVQALPGERPADAVGRKMLELAYAAGL
jgi:hypothetical protein